MWRCPVVTRRPVFFIHTCWFFPVKFLDAESRYEDRHELLVIPNIQTNDHFDHRSERLVCDDIHAHHAHSRSKLLSWRTGATNHLYFIFWTWKNNSGKKGAGLNSLLVLSWTLWRITWLGCLDNSLSLFLNVAGNKQTIRLEVIQLEMMTNCMSEQQENTLTCSASPECHRQSVIARATSGESSLIQNRLKFTSWQEKLLKTWHVPPSIQTSGLWTSTLLSNWSKMFFLMISFWDLSSVSVIFFCPVLAENSFSGIAIRILHVFSLGTPSGLQAGRWADCFVTAQPLSYVQNGVFHCLFEQ